MIRKWNERFLKSLTLIYDSKRESRKIFLQNRLCLGEVVAGAEREQKMSRFAPLL